MKMRRAILLRNLPIFQSPPISKLKSIPPIPCYNFIPRFPPVSQSNFISRFFTSKSIQTPHQQQLHSNSESETDNKDSDEVEDVSNEEFKKRIERYDKGDESAFFDIFEAIVRRKISGNHGAESDDEVLKEFRHNNPLNVIKDDDEVDSDFGDTDSEDEGR